MKKKVICYILLLLVVPLIISLTLSCTNFNQDNIENNPNYVGNLYIPEHDTTTKDYVIKSTNTYAYICIFALFCVGGAVYIIIGKLKE